MPNSVVLTWQGDEALIARLLRIAAGSTVVLGRAVYEEAQEIFAESQEFVPVDLGALRSSGFVSPVVVGAGDVEVQIGYGGAASDYAVIVHEDLTLNHPRGGQAKYLETPVVAHLETFGARLGVRVAAIMAAP